MIVVIIIREKNVREKDKKMLLNYNKSQLNIQLKIKRYVRFNLLHTYIKVIRRLFPLGRTYLTMNSTRVLYLFIYFFILNKMHLTQHRNLLFKRNCFKNN